MDLLRQGLVARARHIIRLIPGSSMVEQEAVNFEVAGSSPVPGAKIPN